MPHQINPLLVNPILALHQFKHIQHVFLAQFPLSALFFFLPKKAWLRTENAVETIYAIAQRRDHNVAAFFREAL